MCQILPYFDKLNDRFGFCQTISTAIGRKVVGGYYMPTGWRSETIVTQLRVKHTGGLKINWLESARYRCYGAFTLFLLSLSAR